MNQAPSLPLRDIHIPDSVNWWPLAPGWWILLCTIVALICLVYFLRRKKASTQSRKYALQSLDRIERDFQQHRDNAILSRELSTLLRRVSLTHFPRNEVAGLTGDLWLEFLDSKHNSDEFSNGTGRHLIAAPYQADPNIDAETLIILCRTWIENLEGKKHD